VTIGVRPELLAAGEVALPEAKVIDLETGTDLLAQADGDRLTFSFPMAASDSHMIVITGGAAQASGTPATEAR